MDMASDSTWAAWIECQRENLNCSATELLWISTAKPSSTQKNVFLGQKPDEYVEPRNMLFKTDGRMQSESWTMDKKVGRGTELCAPFENKAFWQKVEKWRISWPSGKVLQKWCLESMVEMKTSQKGAKDTNLFSGEGNRCCRNHRLNKKRPHQLLWNKRLLLLQDASYIHQPHTLIFFFFI